MTPGTGDIWLADVGGEARRPVYVVSDARFNRLAERAIVAPVLPGTGDRPNPPWWVVHDESVVALDRLSSVAIERLLEHSGRATSSTVRAVQRVVGRVTASER